MRTLKLQVQISVNGYIAGSKGEMDWLEWNWDEDIKNYVNNLHEPVDTIVLGRKLAEGFIPHWQSFSENPETADDFSRKMVNTHKVVFTNTIEDKEDWKNTVFTSNDVTEEINKLKAEEGGDIIVYGGGEFVSSLIEQALIDDFYLFVNPVAISKGMPIFEKLSTPQKLMLVEAKPFACGIVVLHYKKP
jgi:dihydrofolate reductase